MQIGVAETAATNLDANFSWAGRGCRDIAQVQRGLLGRERLIELHGAHWGYFRLSALGTRGWQARPDLGGWGLCHLGSRKEKEDDGSIVVRIPCEVIGGFKRYGVLRLRWIIRTTNDPASLRMTVVRSREGMFDMTVVRSREGMFDMTVVKECSK